MGNVQVNRYSLCRKDKTQQKGKVQGQEKREEERENATVCFFQVVDAIKSVGTDSNGHFLNECVAKELLTCVPVSCNFVINKSKTVPCYLWGKTCGGRKTISIVELAEPHAHNLSFAKYIEYMMEQPLLESILDDFECTLTPKQYELFQFLSVKQEAEKLQAEKQEADTSVQAKRVGRIELVEKQEQQDDKGTSKQMEECNILNDDVLNKDEEDDDGDEVVLESDSDEEEKEKDE